jgi:hypothetical protein
MATLKLTAFSGEIPREQPRLLPPTAAQHAENTRLTSGGLVPVRQARNVYTISGHTAGAVKTIYKHGSEWLAWDTVVNACPGPVAQDRLYYTGDGVPKMRVSGVNYPLAVPFPATALTATTSGTPTGPVTERLYVRTFVTSFGEESEPSPVTAPVNWQSGLTVTLSGFTAAPSGRGITLERIYRSQDSALGTSLFFIAERAASTADFVDTVAPDGFGELLPSSDWNAPPDGLQGLCAGANGMLAGFVGKDLYFSEPYRPHAWPQKYILTVDFNIIAVGSFGTTFVVMTEGRPYIVNGNTPDSMVQEKIERNLPCINARGVVDLGYGVAYPSTDGLVMVSNAGADVVTKNLMARTDWQLTQPDTYVAGQYDGRYFASYSYVDVLNQPVMGTFIIDLTGEQPFILRASRYADACHYSLIDSALYMLSGLTIYEWDAVGQLPEVQSWKSKKFVLAAPASFGAMLVEGDDSLSANDLDDIAQANAAIATGNAALFAQPSIGGELNGAAFGLYVINGDALTPAVPEKYASIAIFADGVLVDTVSDLNVAVRLKPIPRNRSWHVEVSGTAEVSQISMATTMRELNQIG